MNRQRFLLVASFPDSLIQFRGPLIDALLEAGNDVHVAVPDSAPGGEVAVALASKGVRVHGIPLQRTGLNPIRDLKLLLSLVALMLRLRPRFVLRIVCSSRTRMMRRSSGSYGCCLRLFLPRL